MIKWALAIITGFGLCSISIAETLKSQQDIRVLMPYFKSVAALDPHLLSNSTQSLLAANMYSSLLNSDLENGEIVSGLAKTFIWNGNNLILKLRDDYKTVGGFDIDAEDVVLSIKRLVLINRKNKRPIYSRLDELLCPKLVHSIAEDCNNIKVIDKKTLSFTFPRAAPEFLETLAGKPLYIIHKSSFNLKTLELKSHSESTGAYFSSDQDAAKNILKANAAYWSFNPNAPQKIILIDEDSEKSAPTDLFIADKVDFITELSSVSPKDLELARSKVPGSDLFRTNELAATMLIFTNRGLSLPVQVRRELSRSVLKAVRSYKKNLNKYRSANNQYVVPGGFGSFKPEMLDQIEKFIDEKSNLQKLPKIKFAISSSIRDSYRKALWPDLDHLFEYIDFGDLDDFENKSSEDATQPHIYFIGTDLDFYESFLSVSFLLKRESFNLRGVAADEWLDRYMKEPNQSKRDEILRSLHFDSVLNNPSFIPLFTKPYMSLIRNGWKLNFSKNSSLFYFNRIVRE